MDTFVTLMNIHNFVLCKIKKMVTPIENGVKKFEGAHKNGASSLE
jgi:hypothetical protein